MTQLLPVTITVNRKEYSCEVEPRMLLSDFLRHELGLTGTHVGCEHGVCGACTIMSPLSKAWQPIKIISIHSSKLSGKHTVCNADTARPVS